MDKNLKVSISREIKASIREALKGKEVTPAEAASIVMAALGGTLTGFILSADNTLEPPEAILRANNVMSACALDYQKCAVDEFGN